MSALRLLVAKDLRILARSPIVIALLVLYPLAVAVLVGTVLDRADARPRVAFVNEDGLPDRVELGGQAVDVRGILDDAERGVELVSLDDRAAADRALGRGDVAAAIIVPRGFQQRLRTLIVSPSLELVTGGGASRDRVIREAQGLVYRLNQALQVEFIRQNVGFLQALVRGGSVTFLGRRRDVVGLQRSSALLDEVAVALAGTSEAARLVPAVATIQDFARQATLALGAAEDSLAATAHPVLLSETRAGGREALLGSRLQAYGIAVSLVFAGLLLAAGAIALEREEGVVGRLSRGLVGPWTLVGAKIVLAGACAAALGALLALALAAASALFGGAGAPWERLPALLAPLVAAGAAVGAAGVLLGVLARDLRTASIAALAVALPFVLLGVVPQELAPAAARLSDVFPFAPAAEAFAAVLFDAAPLGDAARGCLHLAALAAIYALGARLALPRFWH